ncbi:MAG: hypothetical protein ABI920_08835 [Casimicrobiaceae bacterium]
MSILPAYAQDVATTPPAMSSKPAYTSAFDGYRGFADQPVESWRAANDLVGRIGGWQAYARETRPPAPSSGQAASAGPSATPPLPATGSAQGAAATPKPGGAAHAH